MSAYRPGRPLTLTPNERLARSLRDGYDRDQAASGRGTWETLAACSWSTFTDELWQELCLHDEVAPKPRSLLTRWQQRALWMQVLERSDHGAALMNLPAAARLAAEAWDLVAAFRLADELHDPDLAWDEGTRIFLNWAEDFARLCDEHGTVDRASLDATLQSAIEQGRPDPGGLPGSIELLGFTEPSPSQRGLLGALERAGVQVVERGRLADKPCDGWVRVQLEDPEAELRSAAEWVRALLQQRPAQHGLGIGVVVPDLAGERTRLMRIFDEVLCPRSVLPSIPDGARPYNLSLGTPLAECAMVADALALLALDGGPAPVSDWSVLLRSPFLGEAETEAPARALLHQQLLRAGAYRVDLGGILTRCEAHQEQPYHCPELGRRLRGLRDCLAATPQRQSPSLWASHFWSVLERLGWPGERSLTSPEQQTAARWKELVAQLGSLDPISPVTTRTEILSMLGRGAQETIFQPETRPTGRVEVLGYLEAAGLNFDHLWVLGMQDGAWPQPPRPNPYLPRDLQRRHRLPHSSAERELEFARQVTGQLLSCAPGGVVSAPRQMADQHLRPSPLTDFLPVIAADELPRAAVPSPIQTVRGDVRLEELVDPGPPPVGDTEISRGGTSIFKLQAACPFRAFATLRLGARPLERVGDGLDAAQRGTLLHMALEKLWQDAGRLDDWKQADASRRSDWIARATDHALERMAARRPDVVHGFFYELERRRTQSLLEEWMELEEQRPSFSVLATEQHLDLKFSELKLRVTIDRIDRLLTGERIIIDYKTGHPRVADWLNDRPGEPQLPLYCVATAEPVAAIAFGRVRPGDMAFEGLGQRPGLLDGVEASQHSDGLLTWDERLTQWRETLERLASDFKHGRAEVDPVKRPQTCRYCGLEFLCRVAEQESRT